MKGPKQNTSQKSLTPFAIDLPDEALKVLSILEEGPYEAWCVGGFVRDAILGHEAHDIDIACNAPWQEVKGLGEAAGMHAHETGIQHGTLTLVHNKRAFEVTTYRSDGRYSDARHPDQVSFVGSIEEDLARRDFTINALAYHPKRGLIDPYGGLSDIKKGVVRAVGDPQKRFEEDALRILRACRFCSQLGFSTEAKTLYAMQSEKAGLLRISAERIHAELEKLLLGSQVSRVLCEMCDVLSVVLPELVAMKGFDQHTPYHCYDVLEHTALAVGATPAYSLVRWAALFHDMGKPAAFYQEENGRGHFYAHAKISVILAQGIMQRLSFSPATKGRILALVLRHDELIDPTPKAVKRALRRLGGDVELFKTLCHLKRADAAAQAQKYAAERMEKADALLQVLEDILKTEEAFSLRQLAIKGHDVMALGVPQGPCVGEALNNALEAVIDERVANDKEALLTYLRDHYLAE